MTRSLKLTFLKINMSASNPSTSILYKLYTESGGLINLADLWSAYNAVIDPEGKDNPIRVYA